MVLGSSRATRRASLGPEPELERFRGRFHLPYPEFSHLGIANRHPSYLGMGKFSQGHRQVSICSPDIGLILEVLCVLQDRYPFFVRVDLNLGSSLIHLAR